MSTLLAFLVTLGVLVVVHEYGHYRVARACGVKVLRFSVGFGKVLWRRQKGDTEFVVSLLPLGGYVRMLDERETPVAPHERHEAFNNKPLWQRAAVVAAGPAANLLLAVLLYAVASWLGTQEIKPLLGAPAAGSLAERAGMRAGDWVRAVSRDGTEWQDVESIADLRWHVTQAALGGERLQLMVSNAQGQGTRNLALDLQSVAGQEVEPALMQRIGLGAPYSEPVLGEVKSGGPAERAGLHAGDRVLRVDNVPVLDAGSLRERIAASVRDGVPQPMRWQVERRGQTLELTVQPRLFGEGPRAIGRIDAYVGRPAETVLVRRGPVEGLVQGAQRTWEVSALTLQMMGRMLTGEASLKNISGPLTIADYAGQSVHQGLSYYLGFLALVSVSLGVLNLLPLPMLDGGHLMYYLFEGLTGRPVSEPWLKWLQRGGALILLLLMTLALSNDLARFLGQH
jgi:regulator of sigma E protease